MTLKDVRDGRYVPAPPGATRAQPSGIELAGLQGWLPTEVKRASVPARETRESLLRKQLEADGVIICVLCKLAAAVTKISKLCTPCYEASLGTRAQRDADGRPRVNKKSPPWIPSADDFDLLPDV